MYDAEFKLDKIGATSIALSEGMGAAASLSSDSAPGVDGIVAGMLKYAPWLMKIQVTEMFNAGQTAEFYPQPPWTGRRTSFSRGPRPLLQSA